MKKPDISEITFYWIITTVITVLCLFFAFIMMTDKNRMCRDLGKVLYHRELTWFECMAL